MCVSCLGTMSEEGPTGGVTPDAGSLVSCKVSHQTHSNEAAFVPCFHESLILCPK